MPTITVSPITGDDDAMCTNSGVSFSNANTALNLGNASLVAYWSAVRFPNVAIPQGATIISASILFVAAGGDTANSVNVLIYAENVDHQANGYDTAADIYAAALTGVSVPWNNIGAWTLNQSTNATTPDLSPLIQAVVNRPGWVSGNAIGLQFRDNGSTANANRNFATVNHTTLAEPVLTITFSAGVTTVTKVVGESLTLPESRVRLGRTIRVVSDALRLPETRLRLGRIVRVVADALALAQTQLRLGRVVRVVADALALAQTTRIRMTLVRVVGEVVALSEAPVRRGRMVRTVAESLSIAQTNVRLRGIVVVVEMGLSIGESLGAVLRAVGRQVIARGVAASVVAGTRAGEVIARSVGRSVRIRWRSATGGEDKPDD